MKRIYKIMIVSAAVCLLSGCRDKGPSELEIAREKGISYMEQADYVNAVTAFEEAYALCDEKMPKTKADISLYEAACYFKTEDFESVKNICSRILELTENADAYYMRGAAFLNLNETEAAKADFDCAADLKPADYEMYLNIYRQYEKNNLSAIGDQYLQIGLNIEGEEMEDYYQKGNIYFYLKDYTKAQEMLARPVEQKHKKAMMLMGEVYLALEDSVHARNVYQQYMDEYGNDAAAYNGIVLCELADGNYDAAVSAAETGLGLEGEERVNRDLLYNEIVAYESKHDFEAAKQVAARFMELYPDDEKGKKEYDFLITR